MGEEANVRRLLNTPHQPKAKKPKAAPRKDTYRGRRLQRPAGRGRKK